MSDRTAALDTLRAHVEQWGGLNVDDARDLISLLEDAGLREEYAIQDFDEPFAPDLPAARMSFWPEPEDCDRVRLVGPWREVERP